MSHKALIHSAQTKILRELLFMPHARFADLVRISELENDHAKFHISRLAELGYVARVDSSYSLTVKGKEYANKLDTDAGVIERQPKVAVILIIEREFKGQKQYLLQERLKQPYYVFWGAPGGKVGWGEKISDTASRELKEETGLTGSFVHSGVYHEIVRLEESGKIVEDKVFHIMFCNDAAGQLVSEFEGGHNAWRARSEMEKEPKKYNSFDLELRIGLDKIPFTEIEQTYSEAQF